jgi:hypothetical protein
MKRIILLALFVNSTIFANTLSESLKYTKIDTSATLFYGKRDTKSVTNGFKSVILRVGANSKLNDNIALDVGAIGYKKISEESKGDFELSVGSKFDIHRSSLILNHDIYSLQVGNKSYLKYGQ